MGVDGLVGELRKSFFSYFSRSPCTVIDAASTLTRLDLYFQLVEKFGEGGRTKSKWKIKVDHSEHD